MSKQVKPTQFLSVIIHTSSSVVLYTAVILTSLFLCVYLGITAIGEESDFLVPQQISIMDTLDDHVSNAMEQAHAGAMSVPKHFWIDEEAMAGPVPNPDCYGQSDDPSQLQWLLDDAAALLDGQTTLFSTSTEIMEGSVVNYYLDDSIMAITWKQVFDNFVYTISEVKISDPSQFRRYIADGEFDSYQYYLTTQMSEMTNAVVASSADFYRTRNLGTIVYDRQVKRMTLPHLLDVCYIDTKGDLHFSYRGELTDMESAQKFVDENDILFGLAFGPVLIDDGVRCEPYSYTLGEINDRYPRSALCQYDTLHYLVIAANAEGIYSGYQTIHDFAKNIDTFGCQKAYTMDGGQTVNIVMNNTLINNVNYGYAKPISDIIYFATAIPNQ